MINIQCAAPLCQCHTHSDLITWARCIHGQTSTFQMQSSNISPSSPVERLDTSFWHSKKQAVPLESSDNYLSPRDLLHKQKVGCKLGWDWGRYTLKRALTPSSCTVLLKQSVMPLYMMALPDSACRFCAPAQPDICTTSLCHHMNVICFIFYILYSTFYILYFVFYIILPVLNVLCSLWCRVTWKSC